MPAAFMARQPIFDRRLRVYAYELLFRSGPQNFYQPVPNASATVIADSITLFDLQSLTGNARAFVNVDELALRLDAPRLLPPDRVVVEILETVTPTNEIVETCRKLRAAGYSLALDDFTDHPRLAPLVEMADFLKIDFQISDHEARARIAAKYAKRGLSLLAEKVETEEELAEARRLGFSYFQGYFFCKPSMTETRSIPENKRLYLELLNATIPTELDYAVIEDIFRREPSLLYRFLRYLNSPLLGLRTEVHSVRQALTLLGEQDFRRWVSVFAIVSMSSGKPSELIRTALTRAYFCEELSGATRLAEKKASLFLMGLLSVTDALLDKPIADILRDLPISQEVKTALIGGDENPLHEVYKLLLALEHAQWPNLTACVQRLGCPEENVPTAYQSALQKASAVSM